MLFTFNFKYKKAIQILSCINLCIINLRNLTFFHCTTQIYKFNLARITGALELHLLFQAAQKSLVFILLPFLWRERIQKLFKRNTSSPSITIERKDLFMQRSASIWIAVNYAHDSCVKGKNISLTPSKAGTISSWFMLLQHSAETVVVFSSKLLSGS